MPPRCERRRREQQQHFRRADLPAASMLHGAERPISNTTRFKDEGPVLASAAQFSAGSSAARQRPPSKEDRRRPHSASSCRKARDAPNWEYASSSRKARGAENPTSSSRKARDVAAPVNAEEQRLFELSVLRGRVARKVRRPKDAPAISHFLTPAQASRRTAMCPQLAALAKRDGKQRRCPPSGRACARG